MAVKSWKFGAAVACSGIYQARAYDAFLSMEKECKYYREENVAVFENGKIIGEYTGEFEMIGEEGKRSGYGKMIFDDGSTYAGEWKDDRANGQGRHTMKVKGFDGQFGVYEGQFKNDAKWGHGRMQHPNKQVYEGNWENDKIEGQGIFTWENGNVYEGNWVSGKRQGAGEMHWNGTYWNGRKYKGRWVADQMCGKGTLTYKNGDTYVGNWENNMRHGEGTFTKNNTGDLDDLKKVKKTFYIGNWRNDKRDGYGIYCKEGTVFYRGQWEEGSRKIPEEARAGKIPELRQYRKIRNHENRK